MPQPHWRLAIPASVYITVSWSGITRSPCRSVSSPVLTTTVSRSPTCAARPCASFAPPTPPASATTRGASAAAPSLTGPRSRRSSKELADLGHPLDGLEVVRRRVTDDDVAEPELVAERADLVGDVLRRPEEV